jgi:hypothetical protein
VPKTCWKIYQPQEKFQKCILSPFEAIFETTFDYCSLEIDRKRAEDISDDISAPRKIPKNYFEPFRAYSEATFDYSTTESSQKMSDYLGY